jgi:hypothetical protein
MSIRHEERCRKIVHNIDTLSQNEVEELFRMIHRHNYTYTRNNHGVFINLSWIPEDMVVLMENYIEFCHRSKVELQKYESICDVLSTRMHEDREKEQPLQRSAVSVAMATAGKSSSHVDGQTDKANAKISSSLRFYLLKKKFAKLSALPNNYENDLKQDDYILLA